LALALGPSTALAQGSDLWSAKAKPEPAEAGQLKLEGRGPIQIVRHQALQIVAPGFIAQGNAGIWAMLDDQHKGVGVAIKQVSPGGPAAKAGLKPGQIITEVDGTSLVGLTVAECRTLLTGRAGSAVRIVVMDPKDFERNVVVHMMRKALNNAPVAMAPPPAVIAGPPIGGGQIVVRPVPKTFLVWQPKQHGEETAAQFSTADEGVSDSIRRAFAEAEIPYFITEGDIPTVRVPPIAAIRAKEILQNLRTQGHWSLVTLSTKEGKLTPDQP